LLFAIKKSERQQVREIQVRADSGSCWLLADSAEVVDNLISEVALVADPKPQEISLKETINKLIQQIKVEKKLENIRFYYSYPEADIKVNVPYRNMTNCLHAIIENAGSALLEQIQQPINYTDLYLKIAVQEKDNMAIIDIIDNGIPVPENVRNKIFDRRSSSKSKQGSGYGLWRAKALAGSMGGSLEFLETDPRIKLFRISLPVFKNITTYQKPLAFIIDDERAWRNIISRWLKEENFEVQTADSINTAKELFHNLKIKPHLVLLDISLNRQDGANVDGLSLISEARNLGHDVKIILLTGYAGKSNQYQDDVDLLIEKVSDTKALTKTDFLEKLKELNISFCRDGLASP
jgi:CheY-like chemotaxis protein